MPKYGTDLWKVVTAKWIFTPKADEHETVVTAKARPTASQREGVDIFETFTPKLAPASISLLVSMAC